jgi:hypothetical protein
VVTQAQFGILYGRAVEEFLTGRCTGGKAGWGRRDKDADPAGDTAVMRALWTAAKPKVTQTPCLAVEVDGVVTVHPFPADAAATIALLKTLARDK